MTGEMEDPEDRAYARARAKVARYERMDTDLLKSYLRSYLARDEDDPFLQFGSVQQMRTGIIVELEKRGVDTDKIIKSEVDTG